MVDAEADVGEAHAGDVLAESHFFTSLQIAFYGFAQPFADDFNGLQMHHICQFPSALGDIAFDSMYQGIHTSESAQAFRHGCAHIRIDDGDDGDIVGIGTNEFTIFFFIGDDVIDSNFRRRLLYVTRKQYVKTKWSEKL